MEFGCSLEIHLLLFAQLRLFVRNASALYSRHVWQAKSENTLEARNRDLPNSYALYFINPHFSNLFRCIVFKWRT